MSEQKKSSEDLLREAKQRARGTRQEKATPGDTPAPVIPVTSTRRYDTPPGPASPDDTHSPAAQPWPGTEGSDPEPQPTFPRYETQGGASSAGSRVVSFMARMAVPLLIFGGIALFSTFDDASRDDTGEVVSGGDLDVMDLRVGDCFNDPEELDELVYDVAAVRCADPHDNEVYAVLPISGVYGTDFPGDEVLTEYSYDVCAGEPFRAYVGTDYFDSSLDVFTFTPTPESWKRGDREVVCVLYRLDLARLTGTARDSGL